MTPIEVWFDILQNMSNFASKPEQFGSRYDPIFEACRQSPIPDKDKLQYFRSMFDDDVRSYLTDEDRKEIAEEYYAKGAEEWREKVARQMLQDEVDPDLVSKYTGFSIEELNSLK